MKREIKFRAWDNMTKSMYQVRDIDFLANREINSIRLVIGIQTSEDDIDFDFPIRRSGEYELMQFTGLKDKNGKEIYEGDILKLDDGRIAQVVWYDTGWYIESNPHSKMEKSFSKIDRKDNEYSVILLSAERYGKLKHSEVIGNIYENPELL